MGACQPGTHKVQIHESAGAVRAPLVLPVLTVPAFSIIKAWHSANLAFTEMNSHRAVEHDEDLIVSACLCHTNSP